MKKILVVIGTRPQFIKYAAIANDLSRDFDVVFTDTGQHYSNSLSSAFLDEFHLDAPKYVIESRAETVLIQFSNIVLGLEKIINKEVPDYVLCFGDTNSSLAIALVASKLNIPLIHIEAGERNYNARFERVQVNSIPEEINRVIIDNISSFLYCSSERAKKHLISENNLGQIENCGDITYDLFQKNLRIALNKQNILSKLNLLENEYIFCTFHRALNTDSKDRLRAITDALIEIDDKIIIPMHPRTRKMLNQYDLYNKLLSNNNIQLIEPISYTESIVLNNYSNLVITDSGGVTRESYFCKKKCIYLDDTTEWIDLCIDGWVNIAGADKEKIINLSKNKEKPKEHNDYFGAGNSTEKIVESMKRLL